jgi:electron transfer flavoprotein beta subunit
VTLVSAGQHPTSGRQRRAEQDSRALELALTLTKAAHERLDVVHCGDINEPALRQYAGMGVGNMTVLPHTVDCDPIPALIRYLTDSHADLILTGVRAESGESSGMLPYLLAHSLGMPIINGITDVLSVVDGRAECLQALPRGQRRKVLIDLPCIATVDMAAATPRQSAFGPGQRATFTAVPADGHPDTVRLSWEVTPAKPRPKRLKTVKAKTAAERFKAATAKPDQQGGQVITDKTPDEMAHILIDFLRKEKAIISPISKAI